MGVQWDKSLSRLTDLLANNNKNKNQSPSVNLAFLPVSLVESHFVSK
jgi:hypothetical protein